METIYDHNITSEELISIGDMPKDNYLKIMGRENSLLDLARLYNIRKDRPKSEYYANQLPFDMHTDFFRTINHT